MNGFENGPSDASELIDGLTIMERLRSLGDYKQRIKGTVDVRVDQVREHLLRGSPPEYYDTIRLINVTRGAETAIATIDLRAAESRPNITHQLPTGARIAAWASIGEKPVAQPGVIELFVVIG